MVLSNSEIMNIPRELLRARRDSCKGRPGLEPQKYDCGAGHELLGNNVHQPRFCDVPRRAHQTPRLKLGKDVSRHWKKTPKRQMFNGMLRCSVSLAIPHRIPSVSPVLLGHTNRSVKLPSFRHFQDRLPTTNRETCFAGFVFHVSWAVGITRFESVSESHDTMPLKTNGAMFMGHAPVLPFLEGPYPPNFCTGQTTL